MSLKNIIGLVLAVGTFVLNARAQHASQPESEAPASTCVGALTEKDKTDIAKLMKSIDDIKYPRRSRDYKIQLSGLLEKELPNISPSAKNAIFAMLAKDRVHAATKRLLANKELQKALLEYDQTLAEIDRIQNSTILGITSQDKVTLLLKKLQAITVKLAGNKSTNNKGLIDELGLEPPQTLYIKRELYKRSEIDMARIFAQTKTRINNTQAVTTDLLYMGVGTSMVAAAILCGKGCTPKILKYLGDGRLSKMAATLMTVEIAGVVGGSGGLLATSNAKMVGNEYFAGDESTENYFCRLAEVTLKESPEQFNAAIEAAADNAKMAPLFALVPIAGVGKLISTSTASTVTTALSVGGTTLGVAATAAQAKNVLDLFNQAKQAAEEGDETKARALLVKAKQEGLAIGFDGFSSVVDSVKSAKGLGALRSNFKAADISGDLNKLRSIANIPLRR